MYNRLLDLCDQSNSKTRATWELELGLCEERWEKVVGGLCTALSSAHLALIKFKVIHRVHFSKSRLSEIYPEVEDKCDGCLNPHCHLSHMFFLCQWLHSFWSGNFNIMSTIVGIHLQHCPLIAIFGTPDESG